MGSQSNWQNTTEKFRNQAGKGHCPPPTLPSSSSSESPAGDSETDPLPKGSLFLRCLKRSGVHIWPVVTGKGKEKKPQELKNNCGVAFRVEHRLCPGRRGRNEVAASVWQRRARSARPLPSLMPFSAATRRLCSRRMFSWDTLRLGCLRKHCMVQRAARGEAPAAGRDGGPSRPGRDPRSSRSLRRARCHSGLRGAAQAAAERRQPAAGEGRVRRGVGPPGVSPPALLTIHTGCGITPRRLPAAAQVEGMTFPTVICQWVFMHHFQELEESHILFVAPDQRLGLVSSACPQTSWESLAPPFPFWHSCSVLFPPRSSEEGAKSTFKPKSCSDTVF